MCTDHNPPDNRPNGTRFCQVSDAWDHPLIIDPPCPRLVHRHVWFNHRPLTRPRWRSRQVVRLQTVFICIGTHESDWRWSTHVFPQSQKPSEAHVGYVLSGRMRVRAADGTERDVGPGEAFEVREHHDAWVMGDEPCVALDFGQLT